MQDLDKVGMGRRIRQIRLGRGLRQWELAQLLGTTQSAVHKYEHGVIPEPKRLVALARLGGTTLEWVLTGQHWENGSREQARPTPETLRTADLLRGVSDGDRGRLEEALSILRQAASVVRAAAAHGPAITPQAIAEALHDHGNETLELLESAWRIQRAVLRQVTRDAGSRLGATDASGTAEPTDRAGLTRR